MTPSQLVEDSVAERVDLEFKLTLPDRSDRGRFEFLKDVSALANSGGGSIFFGIAENAGIATSVVPATGETFDDCSRRLGQILDSGVEPRLAGITFVPFEMGDGIVLQVRVPPSFSAPHRVNVNNRSAFFIRNNTHTAEMSVDQLRTAFTRTGVLIDLAKAYWLDDVSNTVQRKTWRPLADGPFCRMLMAPLSAFSGASNIDVQRVYGDYTRFMFYDWGGASRSFNLDGLIVHPGNTENLRYFTEVHRTGIVKTYRSASHYFNDTPVIPSETMAQFIRESLTRFAEFVRDYEVAGPYVVFSAILGVTGYQFGVGNRMMLFEPLIADRDSLLLPEQFIDRPLIEVSNDISRQLSDILWQAFGLPSCNLYNAEGDWSPTR